MKKKLYLKDFPVLIGNLLPSRYEKDGAFDFNSFYENYLLKMFMYAEKIIIYLSPFVLGINLDVILFDDNEDEILKHFKFEGKDELNIKDNIFVINKKGHYENVFSYQDNEKFNYIYKFYRNDLEPNFIKPDPILLDTYLKIENNIPILNNNNDIQNNNLLKQNNKINNNGNNKLKNIEKNQNLNNNTGTLSSNDINSNKKNKTQIIKLKRKNSNGIQKIPQISNPQNNNQNEYPKISNNINNIQNGNFNINEKDYNFKGNTYNTHNQSNHYYNLENNTNNKDALNKQDNCSKCSSKIYPQNKTLNNICKNCLYNEIFNQSKNYYIIFLETIHDKINNVTITDLNINFYNKINININGNNFNLNNIINEYLYNLNLNKNINMIKKEIISYVKQNICLSCHKNINNNFHLKIPCGCHFCCIEHLSYFFKYIIGNRLTYNYKCLCAYEYKPCEISQLCLFLNQNRLYENNQKFIQHLEIIFKNICFLCSHNNTKLKSLSINENFSINFIHKICDDCLRNDKIHNNNCIICNMKHNQYNLLY